jgi:hypothetical protein
MKKPDLGPLALIAVGLAAVAVLSVAWLRSTASQILGKVPSDRAAKTDVISVRWAT